MKPFDRNPGDTIPLENWKCFDNCSACKALKKLAETSGEISEEELEHIFTEAENEIVD